MSYLILSAAPRPPFVRCHDWVRCRCSGCGGVFVRTRQQAEKAKGCADCTRELREPAAAWFGPLRATGGRS